MRARIGSKYAGSILAPYYYVASELTRTAPASILYLP